MKKKILIVLFVCVFILVYFGKLEPSKSRPFEFRGGFRHSGGGYIRSISHVLVNETDYNIEELYTDIYNEFTLMNGVHDEITFYLYDSVENLHEFNHFSTKTYRKSPD